MRTLLTKGWGDFVACKFRRGQISQWENLVGIPSDQICQPKFILGDIPPPQFMILGRSSAIALLIPGEGTQQLRNPLGGS